MSEMAKAARAAMKKKAASMSAGDPHAKVDASSWTPPEMMNTGAKTGLRPVSRRAYKKGGKVVAVAGKDAVHHAGKKPRKAAGGEAAKYANAKVNRNVKDANAEFGKPHVGGYACGGYAKGGSSDISQDKKLIKKAVRQHETAQHHGKHSPLKLRKGGKSCYADGGMPSAPINPRDVITTPPTPAPMKTDEELQRLRNLAAAKAEAEKYRKPVPPAPQLPMQPRKSGGRTGCKADGGGTKKPFRYVGSQEMKRSDLGLGMKRGESGKFENPVLSAARVADEPVARKVPTERELESAYREYRAKKPFSAPEKSFAREAADKLMNLTQGTYAKGGGAGKKSIQKAIKHHGASRKARGGMSMSEMGGNYTGGTRPTGGRIARATGGSAKKKAGKTNINIIIGTERKPSGVMGMPSGAPAPGAMPPPMPPRSPMMPPPGAMPPGGMPPGVGAAPPMPPIPPGAMMGRKAGGRVYRSYKDMDAGSGGGLGRLEKTEIQEHKPRKAGGRTYRSYKDMDAGAGSGLGRKEKTAIQKHK